MGSRKIITGQVVSNKMQKTVVVSVERRMAHPLYERTVKRTSTFMAHDESGRCAMGDVVRIQESRPLSKRKRWVVLEVLADRKGGLHKDGEISVHDVVGDAKAG